MKNVLIMSNYNTWVNEHIFELCSTLSDDDYRMDRKSFFGSIHNTLNHILLVDILWLARLNGYEDESFHSLDQILYHEFDELRKVRVEEDRKLGKFVENLDNEDLEMPVKYRRMSGQQGEETVHEVLLTLFNHQTHHRGQIHTMLTQIGIKNSDMPDLDVVDYLATLN